MINPLNATTEVRSLLIADDTIKSFVTSKIYPIVAPEGTDGDFIFYQRDGTKTEETKEGISDVSVTVNVGVVSESYFSSQQIAMAIYKCLVGDYTGDISKIRLQDSTEDIVDKKYIQILQFTIK
jgi:hypothetical protein